MRKYRLFILAIIISIVSCEIDDGLSESEKSCLHEHFYYTNKGIVYLDSILQFDYLLVGFDSIYHDNDINAFLNDQSVFEKENLNETFDERDGYKLIIRMFTSPKTCPQINKIIENLNSNDTVAFATYTYTGVACFGFNCTELKSYCNNFTVKLRNPDKTDSLLACVERTNAKIKREWATEGLFVGWYTIEVNKNSFGNAMETANYFYETNNFDYSYPSFSYFQTE